MKKTIHHHIYNHLDKLSGGLLKFVSSPNGYLKLKCSGYMDLVVERIGSNEISLTHYYVQNGDLCCDPDMQIRIDFDNKTAEALTFQNWMIFQEVYPEPDKVNMKLKKELNSFLIFWLKNLKNQGFY